jgi:hypothetical protein
MLTVERLRQQLDYDKVTGIFRWKDGRSNTTVGEVAGGGTPGRYWRVCLDGKRYYGHRLAWFYVYGDWPEQIDHVDLNRQNNAISNLRLATNSQNQWNRTKDKKNTSGFKGVRKHNCNDCYSARITIKKHSIHIGCFKTAEEAHQAYINAAKTYYGEFARG